MSILTDIKTVLTADSALMALLTGGIFDDVAEISRQNTAGAFDGNGEIKPCALIKDGTERGQGPHIDGVQTSVTLYFYQRSGYDTVDAAELRTFALLHWQKIGSRTWQIEHDNTIYKQVDDALECSLTVARYNVTRRKV